MEKIAQQRVPVLGEEGLGMELHALDRQAPVPHAHDFAVLGGGGDLETGRQRRPLQVTACAKIFWR